MTKFNLFCFSWTVEEFKKIIFVVEMGFGGLSLNISHLKRSMVVWKRSLRTHFHSGLTVWAGEHGTHTVAPPSGPRRRGVR